MVGMGVVIVVFMLAAERWRRGVTTSALPAM
jgi:hypothetical protein